MVLLCSFEAVALSIVRRDSKRAGRHRIYPSIYRVCIRSDTGLSLLLSQLTGLCLCLLGLNLGPGLQLGLGSLPRDECVRSNRHGRIREKTRKIDPNAAEQAVVVEGPGVVRTWGIQAVPKPAENVIARLAPAAPGASPCSDCGSAALVASPAIAFVLFLLFLFLFFGMARRSVPGAPPRLRAGGCSALRVALGEGARARAAAGEVHWERERCVRGAGVRACVCVCVFFLGGGGDIHMRLHINTCG
eukprot:SAG31_NODE_3922_length_3749_cov_4.089315_3_plen_246_part_00